MKNFIIALSAVAALMYTPQVSAASAHQNTNSQEASNQNSTRLDATAWHRAPKEEYVKSAAFANNSGSAGNNASANKVVHGGHQEQISRLRECVTHCVPSTCRENKAVAQECAKLCKGHNTSLGNWLYRKCSAAAAGIGNTDGAYGVAEKDAAHGWTPGSDAGTKSHASNSVGQSHSVAHSQAQPKWSGTQSGSHQHLSQAPQSGEHGSAGSHNAISAQEQVWTGSQAATLGERTATEAINPSNPYGTSNTDLQLFGLDQEGELLSHSTTNPAEDSGYAHREMVG